MGYVVFSGADYSVLVGLSTGGPLVALDTMQSVSWSEKKTKDPHQDSIRGVFVLSRYQEHPLFAPLQRICNASTIGQLPKFDLHLQGFVNREGVCGTCNVILGITVDRIQDGLEANSLGAEVTVHFTAEGVSHWHKI